MNDEYMSQSSVDIMAQNHKTIILVSFIHSDDYCSSQKTQERDSFFLDTNSYINQFSNPIYT